MDNRRDQERGATGVRAKTDAGQAHDPVYYYTDSGIHEQRGYVPLWLMAVALTLVIWGIYYLIANWTLPSP